jgi:sensor c-di-GMP phosphodiesterase-like protein
LNKSRIIIVATLLIILCIAASAALMFHFAWVRAVSAEHERLDFIAHNILRRAHITFQESTDALNTMAASKLVPCSSEHIALMRTLTLDTPSVEEIGYFSKGLLKCTSWGLTHEKIIQEKPDIITSSGIGVTLRIQPIVVSNTKKKMALQFHSYNILIDPERFVDVLVDPDIQLALATPKEQLIGELHDPDPAILKFIITSPQTQSYENHLIATAQEKNLIAIAIEPNSALYEKLRQQQLMLLPLAALMAAFMIGIVIWLSRRRMSPLGELSIAVDQHEFIVYYQPIVDLKTEKCIGAEALLRWKRPDGTNVSPDFFIPIAEESGLIRPITDQLIYAVIKDLKNLLIANRHLHIAVNLCADDIKTGRVLPVLEAAMKNSGVEPQQIWLEATERGFMDIEAARKTITRARELGYIVAIDDFGTGYSSLSYLQGFPLDTLKIDKSFVDTIGTDSATSSVTPHIISMAKTFNLKIIAEGVERKEQAEYLLEHGVEYGQGWLFAKAMSAVDFIEYCKRNSK